MSADRRIHKLKIRTDDQATVPKSVFLVEDALKTASLPGIPANGQVFIKRLDLGSFLPSVSSRFLSKRIDNLFRHLTPVKVDSAAPDQADANVVWFADALEPYRLLSKLLADGHRPQAWYWPAAVTGWSPHLTISQSVQLIIYCVVRTKSGLTGLTYVLEPLLKREVLFESIDASEPNQVVNWLLKLGLKATLDDKPLADAVSEAADTTTVDKHIRAYSILPAEWKNILHKALQLWRVNDPRTLFIAYLGIARIRHQATPAKVKEMIQDAIEFSVSTQKNRRRSSSPNLHDIEQERPKPNLSESIPKKNEDVDDSFDGHDIRAVQNLNTQLPWPEQGRLFGRFAGELSGFAGLPFLIMVLKRLGFETLLANHQEFSELQLAVRVFWRIAALLQIPEDDPVLAFLDELMEVESKTVEFVAPMHWQSILKPSKKDSINLSLARVASLPGQRLIMDESGRLVLGVWHRGNKDKVNPWLKEATVLHTFGRPRTWNIAKAADNTVRAICRYLRRFSELNLRTLIQRSALIAVTRTHMDITMPLNKLDIRVRSAGLDIDPGWVDWLGRVIQFHYVENED